MRVFRLEIKIDSDDTGHVYPTIRPISTYDFYSMHSVYKMKNHEFLTFQPDLRFEWQKGAKACHFLSQSVINPCSLVIDHTIKDDFLKFKSVPFQEFEFQIKDEQEKRYSWIHYISYQKEDLIDYSKTVFAISYAGEVSDELKFENKEAYSKKQVELGFINVLAPKFLALRPCPFDIFKHPKSLAILVKENVATELKERAYT